MKIGVVSDTHAHQIGDIPAKTVKMLAEVDLIVHAGDFTEPEVLEGLKAIGEVKAVRGNMDCGELRRMLPDKELFEVSGRKIGLVHGSGGPWGIADRIRPLFGDVDIIIFGHSHVSCNQYLQGTLMFNPGRARDSFGIITIENGIKAEIIKV